LLQKQARIKKSEVRKLKNRDILGLNGPTWNSSVYIGEAPVIRRSRQNASFDPSEYRFYNYRSEVLPRRKVAYVPKVDKFHLDPVMLTRDPEHQRLARVNTVQKMISEAPVHPSLEEKVKWNTMSTVKLNDKEWVARESRLLEASKKNGKLRSSTLSREGMHKTLIERYKEDSLKRSKSAESHHGTETSQSSLIRESNQDDFSNSSSSFLLPSIRHKTIVNRRYKKYHHTGKYEISPIEKRNAWSCCLAEGHEARGCAFIVVDPDALNVESI
jgi:hypothetical protein